MQSFKSIKDKITNSTSTLSGNKKCKIEKKEKKITINHIIINIIKINIWKLINLKQTK